MLNDAKMEDITGVGLMMPLVLEPGDYMQASGWDLARSNIELAVGTSRESPNTRGELPWQMDAGSVIEVSRQRKLEAEKLFNKIGL